jgi:mevalonate kinase
MKKIFYSNGKLLITGEYLVLDGAKALALPTKFGQNVIIENGNNQEIKWTSYDSDGTIWFEDTITFAEIIEKVVFEKDSIKNTLLTILHEAYLLNPNLLKNEVGFTISTQLTFPKKWGLGTSSTLINNIAQWIEIDPFVLLKNSFGGSGYDIACAQNDFPIIYNLKQGKPIVQKALFDPTLFSKNLYFVYLNQKQNSKNAIAFYNTKKNTVEKYKTTINRITENILITKTIGEFSELLEEHENLLSSILEIKTVKETLFPDFNGTIKSLGAWGGDFVLVIAEDNPTHYFISKGYETVLKYNEMILNLEFN